MTSSTISSLRGTALTQLTANRPHMRHKAVSRDMMSMSIERFLLDSKIMQSKLRKPQWNCIVKGRVLAIVRELPRVLVRFLFRVHGRMPYTRDAIRFGDTPQNLHNLNGRDTD